MQSRIVLKGLFIMNKFARFSRPALGVSLASLGASAFAAVPAEVTTALGDMKTDGVDMATLVLVAIIAVAAIMFLKKAIR